MVDAAPDRPLIVAAAVVAASNELLYFKSFVSDDQVKLQLAVFASLDFVEEKRASASGTPRWQTKTAWREAGTRRGAYVMLRAA